METSVSEQFNSEITLGKVTKCWLKTKDIYLSAVRMCTVG